MKRLEGKAAIITGASHGIGKTMAKIFSDEGASIVISDLQDYSDKDKNMFFYKTDLRREQDIKSMIDYSIEKMGKLDIVVNNARPKLQWLPFAESMKEWDLGMDVLLKAPALISKYAYPHLKKTKGCIINISSTNSYTISPQPAAYHVGKAGLNQLTRFLAYEYGPEVRVNAICPGLVDLYDNDKIPLMSKPVNKKLVETMVPLKRAGFAKDITEAAIFLASDASSFINGQELIVDGGAMLGDPFHIAHQVYNMATNEVKNEKL